MNRSPLAVLGLLFAGAAGAQTSDLHAGALAAGDARLPAGEYADTYAVALTEDQYFEADLTSFDFDPYLVVVAPSGATEENDDYGGSTSQSRVVTTAAETGTYTVYVTSYAAGETGDYRLALEAGQAPVVTPPPPADDPAPSAGGPPAAGAEAGRPVAAADLVGRWVGGAPTLTQYHDATTGAPAPTSGVGTTLELRADGTFRQSRVMSQTTYGCTSTVNVDEEGTYALERGELVLRQQSGRSWGQTCGGPRHDRTLDPEVTWYAVAIAPGPGGAPRLTRRQHGEFFDELDRQ